MTSFEDRMGGSTLWSRSSDNEWEKFGRREPYYGVLAYDRFRKAQLREAALDEFFLSGEEHIDFVLKTVRACLDPTFSPVRALDFGCGVGRCSIPLARVCQFVVGLDVSDAMLEEARSNCLKQAITNCEFVESDDTISQVSGSFDFIHSFLVFQHIRAKRGERIFERLVELLADDGIAAVQFLYHREESRLATTMGSLRKKLPLLHNLTNLLYGKPWSEPLMEKNVYDFNHLFRILHRHGCKKMATRFCDDGKLQSIVIFFQKKEDTVRCETPGRRSPQWSAASPCPGS